MGDRLDLGGPIWQLRDKRRSQGELSERSQVGTDLIRMREQGRRR